MATTMNTAQKKYTTLEEIEQTALGSVWALNTTDRSGEAGNLIWSVPKLNGNGVDAVRLPKSFIPFDLTQQISKAQLIASSEFRNTVRKGLVRLCNPAYAAALLKSEEGRDEKARVENLMRRAMTAVDNANVTNHEDDEDDTFTEAEVVGGKKSARQEALAQELQKKEVDKNKIEISMKLQTLVNNSKSEGMTEIRIKGALRNYGKVNKTELKYLAAAYKDKPKVMAYLRELRDEMKSK